MRNAVPHRSGLTSCFVLALLLAGCAGREAEFDAAAHRQEVEAWRQARVARLKQPDGWLSLVGLYWLKPGANTFGSDPAGDIVFPAAAPARAGTFHLDGGVVRLEAAPGAGIVHAGQPVDTLTLVSDTADAPTEVSMGSLHWHVIDRDGRLGIRLRDEASPARTDFAGVDAFPVDPAWRLVGRFEPYTPPKTIPIPTILGTDSPQTSTGALVFDVDGASYRLDVLAEPGDSSLFVIFADATNGPETYEAGRYLYVDAPGAASDGRVVIDFNKAYNPPCVFTPYATCPFPPPQNRLPLRVEAGERKYAHAAPHP